MSKINTYIRNSGLFEELYKRVKENFASKKRVDEKSSPYLSGKATKG